MSCRRSWLALALVGGCFADPPPVGGGTSTGDATQGTTSEPPGTSSSGASSSPSTGGIDESSSGAPTSSGASASSDADASTGPTATCGNDIVEDGEMCDGGSGCVNCVFTDYACNPLNNAGCGPEQRCGLITFETETFGCIAPGPGGIGAECGGAAANDGDCATDLTCLFNPQTPLCDVGNCCVRYCSLAEADPGCDAIEACRVFFPDPVYDGLEHLGFCGEP